MPHIIGEQTLLSITEAHQQFGLSHTYLGLLLRKGQLKGVKVGFMWLIYEDSLQVFLTQIRKPGPKPKNAQQMSN